MLKDENKTLIDLCTVTYLHIMFLLNFTFQWKGMGQKSVITLDENNKKLENCSSSEIDRKPVYIIWCVDIFKKECYHL